MSEIVKQESVSKAQSSGNPCEAPCYTVLDLFSGIGGFSLGLEWTGGFRTIAFCEIDEEPCRTLRHHWPDVPIFGDIKELHAKDLPEYPNVIAGGYPCQPFSLAGKRRGQEDDRHLWPEIKRLVRELDAEGAKPDWCLFENVAGHVNMGLDEVLDDLESENYTAWPLIIPACALNSRQMRSRVWILAHAKSVRRVGPGVLQEQSWGTTTQRTSQAVPHRRAAKHDRTKKTISKSAEWGIKNSQWEAEPQLARVADGIPGRVGKVKSLGNTVVPQVVQAIGQAILAV